MVEVCLRLCSDGNGRISTDRKFVRLGVPLTVNAQDYSKSHPKVRVIKVNTVNPLLSPPFSGGQS